MKMSDDIEMKEMALNIALVERKRITMEMERFVTERRPGTPEGRKERHVRFAELERRSLEVGQRVVDARRALIDAKWPKQHEEELDEGGDPAMAPPDVS
jgi:hypothetical protein